MGQRHVVRTLGNAIREKRIGHAYLFSGPRGVGKTTIARILAKSLICKEGPTPDPCGQCDQCKGVAQGFHLDVMEIDGASNNSVEDVRDLREKIRSAPFQSRYRVYIIDEVHMLSKPAFNALLKTLEEPPSHIVFIFATTEFHKVPETIQSRCQNFVFKPLSEQELSEQVLKIASHEGIKISPWAVGQIARLADGSMRDSQGILDQVVAFSGKEIPDEEVAELLGFAGSDLFNQLLEGLVEKDPARVSRVFWGWVQAGKDLRYFCRQLIEFLRDVLVACLGGDPRGGGGPHLGEEAERTAALAKRLSLEEWLTILQEVMEVDQRIRFSSRPEIAMEVALLKLTRIQQVESIESALSDLKELSAILDRIGTGTPPGQKEPTSVPKRVSPREAAPPLPEKKPTATPTRPKTVSESQAPSPTATESTKREPTPPVEPAAVETETPGVPATAPDDLLSSLLSKLEEKKKTPLKSYLGESSSVRVEGNVLRIDFPKNQLPMMELCRREDNLKTLEEVAREVTGRDLQVVVQSDNNHQKAVPPAGAAKPLKPEAKKPDELNQEEVIQECLDVFGGEIHSRRLSKRSLTNPGGS